MVAEALRMESAGKIQSALDLSLCASWFGLLGFVTSRDREQTCCTPAARRMMLGSFILSERRGFVALIFSRYQIFVPVDRIDAAETTAMVA